jgi:class 3 adenylate cyclase
MGLNAFLNDLNGRNKEIIEGDIDIIANASLSIPTHIYLEAQKWNQIDKICVVFVDMVNSSQIDFKTDRKSSAKIYETFTGSLVRTMIAFEAAHIDIQGDGAFAVFDGYASYARGFVAATTFRTYVKRHLSGRIQRKVGESIEIKARAGLSYGDIIVKRVGTRDKNNLVWAYNRVNQAAKLCSIAQPNALVASETAYERLSKIEWIEMSCGCPDRGPKVRLWEEVDEERLTQKTIPGVSTAYELCSFWCEEHGEEYLNNILEKCDLELPRVKSLDW